MSGQSWIDKLLGNAWDGTGYCDGCPAYVDGRTSRVNPGLFNPRGDIMFMTIEPSHRFDWDDYDDWEEYNRHFSTLFETKWTGGPILNELLRPFGLTMEDVWMGDAIKCPPPGGKDNRKRSVEFNHCQHYLREEIAAVQPSCIITLGNHAGDRVLSAVGVDRKGVKSSRDCGRIIETDPPIILSTHWSNNWLHRTPTDAWGEGWLPTHKHLQNQSFHRYMDVVRASLKHVRDLD